MCKRFPAISVSYMNLFRVFIGPSDYRCPLIGLTAFIDPGARFSKAPETFRARKTIAKSRTLPLQSCFIHIFLIWTEVSFIQEVPGPYTSPFLDTDQLNLPLRARKVSGALEKRAPSFMISAPCTTYQCLSWLDGDCTVWRCAPIVWTVN